MRTQKGFTLVEILIVVVILGILAAVVIPQFTEASTEAKTSSLCTDLQTVRSQIELYKVQHNDALPVPESGGTTWNQLTMYSDVAGGNLSTSQNQTSCYGPYLQKIPTNQFNNLTTILVDATAGGVSPGDNSTGWYYNSTTGVFQANDSAVATHKTL